MERASWARRRSFRRVPVFIKTTLVVVGLAWLAACVLRSPLNSPPPKVSRVGVLSPGAPGPSPFIDAFRDGLREQGYVEGQNVLIEYRYAEGQSERFPEFALELAALPVDVLLVLAGTPDIRRVKEAVPESPIVFVASGDPVESGLVDSLARPGGNITGLTNAATEIGGKRLELLSETVPGLSRVAVLWQEENPANSAELRRMQEAARALPAQVQLQSVALQGTDDVASGIEAAVRKGAQGVVVVNSPLVFLHRAQIVELLAEHRLPAIYENREFVAAGGLMAYGPSFPESLRRAAYYVARILHDTRPAELPIEGPMRFDFVLNLKTAQALGITLPPKILQFATEVVE